MPKNKTLTNIKERDLIVGYLESRSSSMVAHIFANPKATYSLWYKHLTHSDLTNRGKRNGKGEGLDKNLLYYLSDAEMLQIQDGSKKLFESAKQSNIGFSDAFYEDAGIPRLQRREGKQTTQHAHVPINQYANVFLVNDTMKYFTNSFTNQVITNLGKSTRWNTDDCIHLDDGDFTPISLTEAIHGLGTEKDTEFHKLRLSMFLNDTMGVLIEKCNGATSLYIMLEKNPRFFTIIGATNDSWEKYLQTKKVQEQAGILSQKTLEVLDEKSRARQSAWKDLLAKEMMNYTTHEGEIFCPFTQINADFGTVPMLFIASHIKRYADSDSVEAFDVNNGLLLCANADSLFDKHMITVGEDKKLIFSFLLDANHLLKQKLLLNQPIFELILNDKRMEYMREHRETFYAKEVKRKTV